MRRTKVVLALVAGVGLCLSMAATASAQATNQPPTVSASRNPTGNVRVGNPIAFTATATDPDDDTLTYLWDFGDGTTSTEQNPTKPYLAAATRTVTVTVSDGKEGGTVTSAPLIRRRAGQPQPVGQRADDDAAGRHRAADRQLGRSGHRPGRTEPRAHATPGTSTVTASTTAPPRTRASPTTRPAPTCRA